MKVSPLIILILVSLFVSTHGKKLTKEEKKLEKKFKKLAKKAAKYEATLTPLLAELEDYSKLANVTTRHAKGTDALTVVDASFTGNQCGQFILTSWSITLNHYHATGGTPATNAPFVSGTFTPVVQGWYHICSFSRFKKGGNSNDVTILVNGAVVAAYGNAVSSDWRTTGVCFDAELTTTSTVQVKHQSTGGSDCIESTGW